MSEEKKLNARIDSVTKRICKINGRLPKITSEIGNAMVVDNLDDIESLESERESLTREQERLKIQRKGLSGQRESAVKADAQIEMKQIESSLNKLMDSSNSSLLKLVDALHTAKSEMDNTVSPEIQAHPLVGRTIQLSRLGAESKVKLDFRLDVSGDILKIIEGLRLKVVEIEGARRARFEISKYI